jgi:hypothetical protein
MASDAGEDCADSEDSLGEAIVKWSMLSPETAAVAETAAAAAGGRAAADALPLLLDAANAARMGEMPLGLCGDAGG